MSLKPLPIEPVPQQTALIATTVFRKGNLYLRLRDELGTLFTDEDFADLYPNRGQPGLPPWRLALVTVMQFLENLSDRQAAEAVRARIDWKYALSLELTDPGFDYSVLSQFRSRLVQGKAEHRLLDRMLAHFQDKGLIKARGRQRTDSTHVLAAIRVLNRLELVAETLRATLNGLAEVAPDQDVSSTDDIHQGLKDKGLLPGTHLVDAGYIDGELLVQSQERYGVELLGPTRHNSTWQAREGGYDQSRFTLDWERQQAICPEGKVSLWWGSDVAKSYNYLRVKVRFAQQDCAECASRAKCLRSSLNRLRTLVLHERAQQEAMQRARARLGSEEGRTEYRKRAGVEGALSQGVRLSGLRQARYRGLDKTHLQHVATAAALNIVRAVNHLDGKPLAQTRVSRLARLYA